MLVQVRKTRDHLNAFGFALAILLIAPFASAENVKTYESKYYTVSSDLTAEEVRGILLRLDFLVPEFNQNFPALRGAITHKFNVQIFRSLDAMHAAGAPPAATGSGYLSRAHKAFILVGQDFEHAMHEMQYHCFIQFCNEAIDNDQAIMPPWMLIGLGRHFRWARFTGDGYVCGLIPWHVVEDTQKYILDGRYRDAADILALTREQVNTTDEFYISHQAWWISHYLDWGDKSVRHEAFSRYLHDVARGITHREAWKKSFGDLDINTRWKEWMQNQTSEIICEGYAQALTQTLTAYLGRATLAGQRFTRVADLINAIKSQELKMADADWLPHDLTLLIDQWIRLAGSNTKLEIGGNARTPQVIATLADHTRIVSTFDSARKGPRTFTEIEGPGRPRSITTPDDPAAAGAKTIILKSARFGDQNNWADVTKKCQSMIVGDMMLSPRSLTEVFGINPANGRVNWLELELVVNGAKVRVRIADNQRMAPFRITTHLPAETNEP